MKKFLLAALMLFGAQAFGLDAVTDADFQAKVAQSKGLVVLVAVKEGCQYCQLYAPNIEGAAKKLASKAKFYEFDIEKNEQMGGALGIRGTPTTIIFKDGKPVDGWPGAVALESDLVNGLTNIFNNADKLMENNDKIEALYGQIVELKKANQSLVAPEEKK